MGMQISEWEGESFEEIAFVEVYGLLGTWWGFFGVVGMSLRLGEFGGLETVEVRRL